METEPSKISHGPPGGDRLEGNLRQLDELLLQALETLARAGAGDSLQTAQASLSGLAERLRERRFHLAVLGQFKRGKSTLLNALLGQPLLPTAVVPLTAVPTFLRSGKELAVTVSFLDNRAPQEHRMGSTREASELLSRLVTEGANPQNHLGIASVEVRHPSPFLAQGVVLIDTPGIGSTLRHNTAVRARVEDDAQLWEESGLGAVERYLLGFLAGHKDKAFAQAVASKAVDVVGEAILSVKLMHRTLELPLEDLEHRLGVFEAKVEEASAERTRAIDLLEGDRRRTIDYLEEQAETLRHKARVHLLTLGEQIVAANRGAQDAEALAEQALAEAVPAMFERELGDMSEALRRRIETIMSPHQDNLDALVTAVRRAAAGTFDLPHMPVPPSSSFDIGTEPYWFRHAWSATLGPISAQVVDRLLPANAREARVRKRLGETVDTLVVRNVENLRWSALQGLEDSFRRFRRELGERLDRTAWGTREAIAQARARRVTASTSVAQEIWRLSEIEATTADLQLRLESFCREAGAEPASPSEDAGQTRSLGSPASPRQPA